MHKKNGSTTPTKEEKSIVAVSHRMRGSKVGGKLTSASKITLLPSGQMTWSTWERTLSHVSSGVLKLAWEQI